MDGYGHVFLNSIHTLPYVLGFCPPSPFMSGIASRLSFELGCHISLGFSCDSCSWFTLFLMSLKVWKVLIKYFVGRLSVRICLLFSHERAIDFEEEDPRDEMPFPSHPLNSVCCQHDLYTQAYFEYKELFLRCFSHKVLVFILFSSCWDFWGEVMCSSP